MKPVEIDLRPSRFLQMLLLVIHNLSACASLHFRYLVVANAGVRHDSIVESGWLYAASVADSAINKSQKSVI